MGARLPQGPLVTPQRNSKLLRMSPSASVVSLWLLPLDGPRAASRVPSGHCGFRQAARMEWIKLRTLRSVKWALLVALAGTAGIGLIGLGLGAIVRHGAAAIAVLFALVFAAPLFGLAQTGARKSRPSSSTRTRWTLTSRRRGHAVAVGRAEHHLRLCRGAAYGRRLAAEPPGRVSGTMRLWTPAAW